MQFVIQLHRHNPTYHNPLNFYFVIPENVNVFYFCFYEQV